MPVPVSVLSRALGGAGIPGREGFPGMGSGLGLPPGRAGAKGPRVVLSAASPVMSAAGAELVEATVDLSTAARLARPSEFAMAFRDEATEAETACRQHASSGVRCKCTVELTL